MSCQNLIEYNLLVQMAYHTKRGTVRSPFGMRRITTNLRDNETHFHGGIDVGASFGTRFYIPKEYKDRTQFGYQMFNGQYITVVGDKYILHILHLVRVLLVKDKNSPYYCVGLANSTGSSTGDHFHFEIHLKGVPVDQSGRGKVDPLQVFSECDLVTGYKQSGVNNMNVPIYQIEGLKVAFHDPCPRFSIQRDPNSGKCPI
ncbi:MAG: hypothetical protein QXS19_09315 [Candidatus Methanomethylicia archaeon]